ncbi:MAG: PIN domain-containing protein [Candidatus Dormibacteria bacterium]
MTARRVVRFIGLLIGLVSGLEYALFVITQMRPDTHTGVEVVLLCMVAGAIFGFFGLEYATYRPFRMVESNLRETPMPELLSGLFGLILGLLLAALAAFFVRLLPYGLNFVASTAVALLFGYWGFTIAQGRRAELVAMLRGDRAYGSGPVILDTSVLIDGRIAEIARAGFLGTHLVAPHFMLAELQNVADSSEPTRRQRGRRGLDLLESLREMPGIEMEVTQHSYPDVPEVDHKLIHLAKELHGAILTTDYNLNKVAGLEGVRVMNINDLANALKPAVVPGEELSVAIMKEGKEPQQGVGYLADGTMVVIDGGRARVGQTMAVRVTSVIQTPAGRMIFASIAAKAPPGALSSGGPS